MRSLVFFVLLAACQSQGTDMGTERISPTACATCHTPEFKAAKDHEGVKPNTCGICHSQMTWAPSRINHPFPLIGAHGNGHCLWCHRGEPPKFTGTKKECWACHKKDFEAAEVENHETFQHTCDDCHSTVSWVPALENANIPVFIPVPDAAAAPPDAGVHDAGPKPIPTVIPTVRIPPKKKDSGVDIITHPSRGGGEDG